MELRGSDVSEQQTPTPTSHPTTRGETPKGRPGITPLEMFRFEHQKANLAYWVAGGSLAFALVVVAFVSASVGRTEKVFVLDAAGNVHYGPLVTLSSSLEMLQTVSVLATQTAMSRSSVGFDLPEFTKALFRPIALGKLEEGLDAQTPDLRARALHQKPVITQITGPVSEGSGQRMEVIGKVIRAGIFGGRAIYEEAPFKIVFTFIRNPNIGDVACYPWVVSSLEITEEPAE